MPLTAGCSHSWGSFCPWTTLAYAGMWDNSTNEVAGFEWFIVILAFLVDIGSYAGGRWGDERRS